MKKTDKESLKSMKTPYRLSVKEEVGNVITHALLLMGFLIALPFACLQAWLRGSWIYMTGIFIYILCMIFMSGGSALYHCMPYGSRQKYVFRKLDHSSILLAIAGNYTHICLMILTPTMAHIVLGIEWSLAIAGILLKIISSKTHSILSMTLYMIMGWLAVLILPFLIQSTSVSFLLLMLTGGLCYTAGACFFAFKRPWMHFIWHLFIDAAAIFQFIAIVCFL